MSVRMRWTKIADARFPSVRHPMTVEMSVRWTKIADPRPRVFGNGVKPAGSSSMPTPRYNRRWYNFDKKALRMLSLVHSQGICIFFGPTE
jgi:hypothetical protein